MRLYNLKIKYGWGNTSLSELLSIISDILPENNKTTSFLYEAKKTLGVLELSYQKIDACSNNCCLYRKECANMTKCPKCDLSRRKIVKNSINEKSIVGLPSVTIVAFQPRDGRLCDTCSNSMNKSADQYPRVVGNVDVCRNLHLRFREILFIKRGKERNTLK